MVKRLCVVIVVFGAAGLSFLTSCSRPKPVVAPPPPPTAASRAATGQAGDTLDVQSEPTIAPAGVPESGISAGELPADVAEINRAGYLKDVFFETDKSELTTEARELLAINAFWLSSHTTVQILVEGHCDERNTSEYNLALGWRRANAVKAYLQSLGVVASRIQTISYGEEKPFAIGHDESSWWQNRRAHLVVTAR